MPARSVGQEGRLLINDGQRGAWVEYFPDVIVPATCAALVGALQDRTDQFKGGRKLTVDGWSDTPRLVASYGDRPFRFVDAEPSRPFFEPLDGVRARVQELAGHCFDYALVNWYRSGADLAGWHADKMEFHRPGTSIAVLSLGASRSFCVRDRTAPRDVTVVEVTEGSVLLMGGSTQDHYEHAVPPVDGPVGPRWSVTFRWLVEDLVDVRRGDNAVPPTTS